MVSDTDLESTDDELGLHAKHEKYLIAALTRMSALSSFTWSCTHSPTDTQALWPILRQCKTLTTVEISDNSVFSDITNAGTESESDDDSGATNKAKSSERSNIKTLACSLRSISLRSTHHAYGAPKTPTLSSITPILNQCPSLESLEISYVPPKLNSNPTRPSVDELFLITRFPNLTHLYLNDLRYTVPSASSLTTFLSSHANIRVMHLDVSGPGLAVTNQGTGFTLPGNTLPVLQEIKAPKSIINAVLTCPMLPTDDPQSPSPTRPLATIKNIRLTNLSSQYESIFLQNLRAHAHSIRHLEISHFVDIDDIRRVCINLPGLTWLDIGLRDGRGDGGATRRSNAKATGSTHSGTMGNVVPVVNTMEWADALSNAPELHTVHGVRFFYEVSLPTSASTSAASLADRSRIRKNDEIASILAWKCPKLRRVDHWEAIGGTARAGSKATNGVESSLREKDRKVIILLRENEKVRWEVRKVKS
ncbi:hypothetical protein ONZ45_g12213 [Pleurotus djamor]|nr:hypothetical protein ONZ45_g12213 [Pleurotus djamor]